MTYEELRCDICGGYGDVICTTCKMRGHEDYCFCEDCIDTHLEEHEGEEEDPQA